jgi:gliding motility-associated-like protein
MNGQLGFCLGNSGDSIFTEDFGTGTDTSLPPGTTTYTYANGTDPNDGFYKVTNNTNYFDWFDINDHTPNDINGRMLVVNSDFIAGEFYRTSINGLCENTTYEFSSWVLNLSPLNGYCSTQPSGTIPINVRFEIWDNTNSNLLASGSTNNILSSSSPNWDKYALVFQTLPNQTSIILKMINNGIGGCGNDLAIDDIEFKSCGDSIKVTDSLNNDIVNLCSTQTPFNTTLIATPDYTVFSSHFYQWQQSTDGINWDDIPFETNQSLSISISSTMFYRVKVAEADINLNNLQCILFSDEYEVLITQAPIIPTLYCWETTTFDDDSCSWNVTGSQPNEPTNLECWQTPIFNNSTCNWEITGVRPIEPTNIECWQTVEFNDETCIWDILGIKPLDYIKEYISFCENESVVLSGNVRLLNPEYIWNTGAITEEITVDIPGIYFVEVSNSDCEFVLKTIHVSQNNIPIISSVVSDENVIIITTLNEGEFEYSLDGINFQLNNIFYSTPGGLYIITVRERNSCGMDNVEYLHFIIPEFFTPNNDSYNDYFDLKGIEYFDSSEVYIFDRLGKLIKSSNNGPFTWDGTFNNQVLPNNDYWYFIKIEGQEFRGHFTLKR